MDSSCGILDAFAFVVFAVLVLVGVIVLISLGKLPGQSTEDTCLSNDGRQIGLQLARERSSTCWSGTDTTLGIPHAVEMRIARDGNAIV
jgi:hypothetical protein